MSRGLYIHIPFCKSRCIYCGFYSTTFLSLQDRYTDALCHEMELRSFKDLQASEPRLSTIYLGGGTPSLLSSRNIKKLFLYINNVYGQAMTPEDWKQMEVTMECNPDDISDEFCNVLRQLPVNRISMGVQTFSDDRLRFLHRRHTVKQVEEAVKRIRDCGIKNISIDLMFGFPNEKISEWEEDIRHALSLNVEHISAYSLMYDEGTRLDEMRKQHLLKELDEEVSLQMYEMLIDKLTLAGYEHYEISNFALPGYRSRHNSSYWQNTPYIGIGAAAHSYDLHKRQWNIADIREYMDSIEKGIIPCEYEVIDEDTHYNDLITTALRTKEGICLNVLPDKYKSYLIRNAQRHIENQLLAIDDGRLHLTRKGIFVSDDIMSDLIFV